MSLRDHVQRRPSGRGEPSNAAFRLVLIAVITLVTVGAILFYKSRELRIETDRTSLCPTTRPVTAIWVVLLDVSDQFSQTKLIDVSNRLKRLRDHLPKLGLIEVYAVDTSAQRVAEPLIHLCNPGSGEDVNSLYQNPQFARKRWDDFTSRLDAEMGRLLEAPKSATSPIFETIQSVALRTFGKPEFDSINKRLIVVSDLLQNVPGKQNHYREKPRFDAFRKDPYFSQVRADLDGVNVDIYYLRRSGSPVQGADHVQFWQEFFAAQGATVNSIESIYGDN